jgi:hypothetical protein
MNDPAQGVAPALVSDIFKSIDTTDRSQLPHLHLLSSVRYPTFANVPVDAIVDFLLKAPSVVQTTPFNWTFLDGPADGSLYLVWQPLNQLNTQFSSDGYVWADPEQAFTMESKGYVSEL